MKAAWPIARPLSDVHRGTSIEFWLLRAAQAINQEFSLGLQVLPEIKMSKRASKHQLACTRFWRGRQEITINKIACERGTVAKTKATSLLSVLLHELIHCSLPPEEMHGRVFVSKARRCGLKGNATSTYAGTGLSCALREIIEELKIPIFGSMKTAACKTAR